MADVIRLEKGFSPWQPASDAHLVKEYAYYEIPLRGVVEQHGVRYYFGCAAGRDEPVNVWVYVRLSADDEATLDSASYADFDHAIPLQGPGMLALAIEGPGVVATYSLDSFSENELARGYRALIGELESMTESARELIFG